MTKTYPEMNGLIVALLEGSDSPSSLYAAQRIRELEAELAALRALRPGPFDITVGGVKVGEIPEPSPDGTCNPECAVNVSPWFHGDHWQCGFMWDGKAPRKAENSYYQHSPGESCPRHPDYGKGDKG